MQNLSNRETTTAIVLQISLLLSRFIPSISEIGVFQYICILVLSEVSVDHSTAFTFSVILHVVLIVPYLIFGMLLLPTTKTYSNRWNI